MYERLVVELSMKMGMMICGLLVSQIHQPLVNISLMNFFASFLVILLFYFYFYLDNIVIYSKNIGEYELHIYHMLLKFIDVRLYVNMKSIYSILLTFIS